MNLISTIRSYLELGRAHGAGLTAACALVGAYTTGAAPSIKELILITVVGICYHFYGCALNELMDIDLDSSVPELKRKPLVSGAISKKAAWVFISISLVLMIGVAVYLDRSVPSLIALIMAIIFGGYYDIKGKRTPWMGELSLGIGFVAFTVWGATALKVITPLTIVAAVEIFIAVNFSIWGGFMKDVETDRKQGIPTRPVAWGYKHGVPITLTDKNFLFALGMKIVVIAVYIVPALAMKGILPSLYFGTGEPVDIGGVTFQPVDISLKYLIIFFIIGLPGQIFVLYKILGVQDRKSFTKIVVLDLGLTWILAAVLIIDFAGWIGSLVIFVLPFVFSVLFNRIIYGSRFIPKL